MTEDNIVNIVVGLVILALFFWSYKKSKKEGFFLSDPPQVLSGYNNILLTNPQGDMSSIQFPKGIIVMWNGDETNVPQGWALCDGTSNGTPDLRGRFVLGLNPNRKPSSKTSQNKQGDEGGEEQHTLTIKEMPSHTHNIRTGTNSGSTPEGRVTQWNQRDDRGYRGDGIIESTGGSEAHNNMPPYYVLAYIMKL